jgi:transcription initiation factor TFIIIB Brf1 subunit/transcription initiation factor TFIIB
MAKKVVKKVKRASCPLKITCPCCGSTFNVINEQRAVCADCGTKINIYTNEADADEAVEGLKEGKKTKLSGGGGWVVAECIK